MEEIWITVSPMSNTAMRELSNWSIYVPSAWWVAAVRTRLQTQLAKISFLQALYSDLSPWSLASKGGS